MSQMSEIVGKTIARRRKARGLTQADLGQMINASRTSIANLEAGRQNVSLRTIYNLCQALNCMPNDLFEGVSFDSERMEQIVQIRQDINAQQTLLRALLNDDTE